MNAPLPTDAAPPLVESSPLPEPPPVLSKPPPPISVGVLGKVDALTEAEMADYQKCEHIINGSGRSFVEVGLTLAEIRDRELYRTEFEGFPAYCRAKWDYSRRHVDNQIAAALTFTRLRTNCSQHQSIHESHLRPLVGLEPEQAQMAWECAGQIAGKGRITARMVKMAVRVLQSTGEPPGTAKLSEPKPNRAEQQRTVENAITELMTLVRQKAASDILLTKLEYLHGQFRALMAKPRPQAR